MSYLFSVLFFQPILNLVIFIYNHTPGNDLGVAIVLMTLVIKFLLYPLSKKAIAGQKALQDLQPKVEQIKKDCAGNQEEMGRKMMALYKDNKVNPFSSCLPLLVQLPFFFAVFQVFREGFTEKVLSQTYSFIYRPEVINSVSLGFVDLAKPNVYLAVLAGLAQFWQAKMMMTKRPLVKTPGSADEDMMAIMNKQMLYIMPVMTIFIGLTLPGGLSLYWLVTTLFQVVQQYLVFREKNL
jgi:YidC/Oxa1 family membrane protein insertase